MNITFIIVAYNAEKFLNNSLKSLLDQDYNLKKIEVILVDSKSNDKTKKIILAHLSEENNTEVLALNTLNDRLSKEKIAFNNIIIAKQNKETELITI